MEASSRTTVTVLAVVGTLLAGVSAYAIYFDHKRRTDPDFRRLLRRDQKKLAQLRKDSAHESAQSHQQSLKAAHKRALADELPSSPEDRENAFMQEVAKGETLYARGESMRYEAAICFYRALKMYPQPAELTRIYQQTIPPFVFEVVMGLVAIDEEDRLESLNERVE